MKNICVVVLSRANYSTIKSVLIGNKNHPELQLQLVVGASALLDKYGNVAELIKQDGFSIDEEIFGCVEGNAPEVMAKTTGILIIELSSTFKRIQPDLVITVGDRYETMATTLAAAYMNIPLAHTMGGEVTGTIDESIRHAITKFSHLHFPASADAAERISKLGEIKESIHNVGCPRIDLVSHYLSDPLDDLSLFQYLNSQGIGSLLDVSNKFLLVSQHPVTTEFIEGEVQMLSTLEAIRKTSMQAVVLWPNVDAGSEGISRAIRKFREQGNATNMRFYKNLPIQIYVNLMRRTSCLVGNSSSGIREGAFIGTPVVNIGSRQSNRERGLNVIDVQCNQNQIYDAIIQQINHGSYRSDPIYGCGNAGDKVASIISKSFPINIQKLINY